MGSPSEETTMTLSYRGIADDLRAQIQGGAYGPGDRLPTYPQLAAAYGVHVDTVRRGVQILMVQGWVRSEQGRGLFVPDVLPGQQEAPPPE